MRTPLLFTISAIGSLHIARSMPDIEHLAGKRAQFLVFETKIGNTSEFAKNAGFACLHRNGLSFGELLSCGAYHSTQSVDVFTKPAGKIIPINSICVDRTKAGIQDNHKNRV